MVKKTFQRNTCNEESGKERRRSDEQPEQQSDHKNSRGPPTVEIRTFPDGRAQEWIKVRDFITPADALERYEELGSDNVILIKLDHQTQLRRGSAADLMAQTSSSTLQNNPSSGKKIIKNDGKWTEKEHGLFLIGLEEFGKGEWRSISKFLVKSRSPQQVASHAQKFFNRKDSGKQKRRFSSRDIMNLESVYRSTRPKNSHNLAEENLEEQMDDPSNIPDQIGPIQETQEEQLDSQNNTPIEIGEMQETQPQPEIVEKQEPDLPNNTPPQTGG